MIVYQKLKINIQENIQLVKQEKKKYSLIKDKKELKIQNLLQKMMKDMMIVYQKLKINTLYSKKKEKI